MYARPKPEETESDLFRLQAEFLKNKNESEFKIAATVVNDNKEETDNIDESHVDIQEQIANTFEAIPITDGLKGIQERTVSSVIPELKFNPHSGFPKAKRRDMNITGTSDCSVFARQFKKIKKMKEESMDVDSPSTSSKDNKISITKLPVQSYILSGQESDQIHHENLRKIKNMTEEEILEERERLLASMDPALIQFLKSRRPKAEINKTEFRNRTIKEQNEAAQNVDLSELDTPNELLKQPDVDKWINFDVIETNKLAWMKRMDIPKISKEASFEARFNFDGWLLPYSETEITEKSRILYHHGEEAGRPGYTLQELFQLARSNVIQQKILALNAIANILALESTGVYCDVLEIPVEQVFFVLRFCLDDNTPSVLNASIKAMRNLFYNKLDETCLDCLLGFGLGQVQPLIGSDDVVEDDDRENDQQLAEKNLVRCLTRTEILVRIRYIINTIRPPVETICYCIDLLTRLVRDSNFVMRTVYNCENLLKSIITHFVPKCIVPSATSSSPYGVPLLQALKLLRLLACRSKEIANELIDKYSVMEALIIYLSSENYTLNVNGLRLQTESFHLWSVFVHYNIATEYFGVVLPVIMEMLTYHYKSTDLNPRTTFVRHGHVASLLILIGNVCLKQSINPSFASLIFQVSIKWIKQLMISTEFKCGKLQIPSSVFYCLSCLRRSSDNVVEQIIDFEALTIEMLQSDGFLNITNTVKNGSLLLNNYETIKSSANLKNLESAAWYASEHIIPIIQTNSCLPFLNTLSTFIEQSSNKQLKLAFLTHINIKNYIEDLTKSEKYFSTSNWFTRVENNLIMQILKCAITIQKDLNTASFYELAVKTLSTFNSQQKPDIEYILENIIFSTKFYPSEALLRNLKINVPSTQLAVSLENLEEIQMVYSQVLGLQSKVPDLNINLCLDHKVGNIIPLDWVYTPIILLYSQQQNKETMEESQQIFIIKNCLRWILIYDTYFPELSNLINPTDRFCRIICTFLGSDNLFLIPEIHSLLELCLKHIVKYSETQIDFNKEIQGLNNFQDLYIQLLEQYQSVSYGDNLFGNFLLVPLVQRHNVKWRKILWSEYLGVVETFNVTEEYSNIPLESFLIPEETDLSLLKCYRRALMSNSIRKTSILFKIAKHHVETYIKNLKGKNCNK